MTCLLALALIVACQMPDQYQTQPPPKAATPIALVVAHFPPEEWDTAMCVIEGESRGRADALGDDGASVGLFQIKADNLAGRNVINGLRDEFGAGSQRGRIGMGEATALLLDADTNVRLAAAIWAANGWLPAWQAQRLRCGL